MTKRALLTPLVLIVLVAIIGVGTAVATNSSPTLGLDLQGGFSVVLQAKEVNGRLPAEDSVEKAKDIIRQRVDGLGVAEPDITRQGRTVLVQLPGVKNRKKAESLVGCTARLEFRPVVSQAVNPAAAGGPTTTGPGAGASTTAPAGGGATTSTPPGSTTVPSGTGSGESGLSEHGTGAVGLAPGEGALPIQFAPTTTEPPTTTTAVPETTTPPPPPSTSTPGATTPGATTSVPGDTTSTTLAPGTSGASSSCGDGGTTATPVPTANGTQFPSQDGKSLYTLGPVGFTGEALSSATAALSPGTSEWTINVSVKNSSETVANAAFNACYQGAAGCPAQNSEGRGAIAIVLDGEVLSAPAVNGPDLASGQQFTISGDFSEGEAKDLALVLRYGSLPVEFEQAALQQVSATLGADSLRAGLIAGLIGVAALAVYMVLYYRGFGMVVVVSLVVWAALMYALVCLLSATQGLALTLAGITGIIVSVGTTVDTYVVVFERIKDELRNGRSVRAATERGYRSGINTVFTANGAAFIGAFLLWYLTVGPVRGFAYFLGISVILDLAVAVIFTRPLILLLSRSPRFAHARFFGIGASTDQAASPKGPRAVAT